MKTTLTDRAVMNTVVESKNRTEEQVLEDAIYNGTLRALKEIVRPIYRVLTSITVVLIWAGVVLALFEMGVVGIVK